LAAVKGLPCWLKEIRAKATIWTSQKKTAINKNKKNG
jgi:hypothetical protein